MIDEPALLKDYALAVTVSDYIDLRLLDVLRNQFCGQLLLMLTPADRRRDFRLIS